MRSLLALVLGFLRAALGKSRAEAVPSTPIRTFLAPRCQRAADVIEADFLLVVRPYLVVHGHERRRQRERRRATVPAVVGQDYVSAATE
ncbi:hypothetical protein ACFY2Z_28820 [Streptomyces sp. NPDC001222]|uniref:hypothetical protein n=1 Tax=Streptomyces sp. NPDC001222 TaxID=3364548 RepID=UPI0036BBDD6F